MLFIAEILGNSKPGQADAQPDPGGYVIWP
jgi:hypothetical protein